MLTVSQLKSNRVRFASKKQYGFIRPLTKPDLTGTHFIVVGHAIIETCVPDTKKKCLIPSAFPILGCLRHQTINSTLSSSWEGTLEPSDQRNTHLMRTPGDPRKSEGKPVGLMPLYSYLSALSPNQIWHKVILWEWEYARIETCAAFTKIVDPVEIPLLGCLRHQVMNSTLSSRYC